ncbi:MAG: hypothetical protein WAZ78_00675 [Candidatus Moraniibacteriota bacterium]
MLQGFTSAECSVENVDSGKERFIGSIIPMKQIAKDVDWKNREEIRDFFQKRFSTSSLPFEVRLRVYTDLMMALSLLGLIFPIEAKGDLRKLRKGVDAETIQSILLPEMDYKQGTC